MVENNILVRTTDIVRCVECALRSYYEWVENQSFMPLETGAIWGTLEHNTRAILMNNIRVKLQGKKDLKDYNPLSLIDKVISDVYDNNPELFSYPPETIDREKKDIKARLTIEENNRLVRSCIF